MATGTKPKPLLNIKAALVVVALIGSAALVVQVKGQPHRVTLPSDDDLHENITLSVMFTPKMRTRSVNIQAHVEGVRVVPPLGGPEFLPVRFSPWNQTVRVPKGVQVSLYAFQDEAPKPGNLDCLITDKKGVLSSAYRNDPGSIRCFVNRVGG